MSAFLSPADLVRLTRRKRPGAQRRRLDELGIRYIPSAAGEPLVRPEWLDERGRPAQRSRHRWDLIGGAGATVTTIARARR